MSIFVKYGHIVRASNVFMCSVGNHLAQCPTVKGRIDFFAAVFCSDFIEAFLTAFGFVFLGSVIPCEFFGGEKQPCLFELFADGKGIACYPNPIADDFNEYIGKVDDLGNDVSVFFRKPHLFVEVFFIQVGSVEDFGASKIVFEVNLLHDLGITPHNRGDTVWRVSYKRL